MKEEIIKTLEFFVQSDLNIYGHITEGTVEAYKVQKVEMPEKYKKLIKK